jgi:hypothetical protein
MALAAYAGTVRFKIRREIYLDEGSPPTQIEAGTFSLTQE